MEFRFRDIKVHTLHRVVLRIKDRIREILHPSGDREILVISFERRVVVLAFALNRVSKRYQTWLTQILSKRFFGERPGDPTVSVLEWVNAYEMEMHQTGTFKRRQRSFSPRRGVVEPFNEILHLIGNA